MAKTSADLLPGISTCCSEGGFAEAVARLWGTAAIAQISKDVLDVPQGSLYPALYRLEHQRPDQRGVGREREQTPREVLHADAGRPKTPSGRNASWNRLVAAIASSLNATPDEV